MTTDGKSFWPQLQGDKGSPREWSYCWYERYAELQFEFAQNLDFKLYRDGNFVKIISDHEEQGLTENLSAEATEARAKLANILEQYRTVRPANLKKIEPAWTQPKSNKKKQKEDE
jgi:arylsulfatase A